MTDLADVARVADGPFLRACRGLPHDTVPVWFMRQAGRALPEYRALRERHSFEELVHTPELAAEVTRQPISRYGVDAAILFSDIVTPLQAVDVGVTITPGIGPVVAQPFRSVGDLDRLRRLEPEDDIPYVLETVSFLVRELDVPLIGFGGAPFTLASYLIEGGPSRTYPYTRALMREDELTWHRLLDRLAEIVIASLRAQVRRGASAVQVFDSWAGALTAEDYVRYVQPHSQRIFEGLEDLGVPRIHFGVGTPNLLGAMAEAGADVVGVDWLIPLDEAAQRLPPGVAIQGNLEPAACLEPWEVLRERALDVLRAAGGRPDHIFNLGHGVLPDTDPDALARLVELVHTQGVVRPAEEAGPAGGGAGGDDADRR